MSPGPSAEELISQVPAAALVVAHPDDEILWFSSIVARVARVIVCYSALASSPAISAGRERVLPRLPYSSLACLKLAEAEVFNTADWPDPVPTGVGLAVRLRQHSTHAFSRRRYATNFRRLCGRLESELSGFPLVFTHSPWGEYGHEEHVQVFRAVASLQPRLGFRLCVPAYASNRSVRLFARHASQVTAPVFVAPTDRALATAVMKEYQREGCWTWSDDYQWPAEESFIEWPGGPPSGAFDGFALRFIQLGSFIAPPRSPSWNQRIRHVLRRVRDLVRNRAAPSE